MRRIFGVALLLSAGVSGLAMAPKPTETPVTSIISDYDSGVAPALQIQSDKLGAYTNSTTLTSAILVSGTWIVTDYFIKGATRTICLSFNQPIPGTGPNGGNPISPASTCYVATLTSECNKYNSNPLTLPAGQSMPCPMNVHFNANNETYDLHMNPLATEANFSETNPVTITCIYPTSGSKPCSQWRIKPSVTYVAPDGTTQFRNVANLSQETVSKGRTVFVKQGDFYISFSIIFTNP